MSELMDTREEVELPPFDERAEQTRDYWKNDKSGIGVVCVLQGELSCRERQLKSSLATNREQKAEIERLKVELAKRASAGGKWIDVKQELPPMGKLVIVSMRNIVQTCLYSWNEIDRCWSPFDEDYDSAPDGTFDFWQPLPAPPTLPTEEK